MLINGNTVNDLILVFRLPVYCLRQPRDRRSLLRHRRYVRAIFEQLLTEVTTDDHRSFHNVIIEITATLIFQKLLLLLLFFRWALKYELHYVWRLRANPLLLQKKTFWHMRWIVLGLRIRMNKICFDKLRNRNFPQSPSVRDTFGRNNTLRIVSLSYKPRMCMENMEFPRKRVSYLTRSYVCVCVIDTLFTVHCSLFRSWLNNYIAQTIFSLSLCLLPTRPLPHLSFTSCHTIVLAIHTENSLTTTKEGWGGGGVGRGEIPNDLF